MRVIEGGEIEIGLEVSPACSAEMQLDETRSRTAQVTQQIIASSFAPPKTHGSASPSARPKDA